MAQGPLPDHLNCLDAERILALALASAAEISALSDRIDVLERFILERIGASAAELLDQAQGDEPGVAARTKWRKDFVARLMRSFEAELETGRIMSRSQYQGFMDALAQRNASEGAGNG